MPELTEWTFAADTAKWMTIGCAGGNPYRSQILLRAGRRRNRKPGERDECKQHDKKTAPPAAHVLLVQSLES
jgi:hypothetical protein